MESEILELVVKMKDLSAEVIKRLKENLDGIPESGHKVVTMSDKIGAAWANLKEHWVGISAAIYAGWAAISKAIDWAKIGAQALQAEESFKQVTHAYGEDGDKLIAKLEEVSVSAIDTSDMMQRAVKGLQQGLSGEQLVKIMEIARFAARTAGTDIATAFEGITNAIANQQLRALKQYGLIVDTTKAQEAYARSINTTVPALTEHQQQQALLNAVLEEGTRQTKSFANATVNASEKFQQANAQMHDLKETIGKGIVVAMQIAGGAIYWVAAGALTLSAVFWKLDAAIYSIRGKTEEAAKANETAALAFKMSGETAEKGMKIWEGVGEKAAEASDKTKGLAKAQLEAADAAANLAVAEKKRLEDFIALKGKETAAFQAASDYELEVAKVNYQKGVISLQEFEDKKLAIINASKAQLLKSIEEQIEALNKLKDLPAPDPNINQKIQALEEEKSKIILDAERKIQAEQLVIQQEQYTQWKTLEDLKLAGIKANLALADALDEAAVSAGTMRQSEALANKLDRLAQSYAAELSMAEENAAKMRDAHGYESTEYKTAIAEKEQLQLAYQATVTKSEVEIAETKKKEVQEAESFVAGVMDNSWKQQELARQQNLEQLQKYYQQGLIAEQDYQDALSKLQGESVSEFEFDLHERTRQLNEWAAVVANRLKRTQEVIDDFTQSGADAYAEVKERFGGYAQAMSQTSEQVVWQMKHLNQTLNFASYETFWNATIFGKRMIEFTGQSVYEWMRKVTGYIQYIKGLLASLQEQIAAYQLELMQLRGDRLGELEAWRKEESEKLKLKFKDLQETKEYYEALALLDELYAEKKKKILEDQAQEAADAKAAAKEKQQSDTGGDTGTDATGAKGVGGGDTGGGGLSNTFPDLKSFFPEPVSVPSTINTVNATMSLQMDVLTYDQESTNRWVKDKLMPQIFNEFALRGVKI